MKYLQLFCVLVSTARSFSFSGYPRPFVVAPANAAMTAKYDLSGVPNIDLASPRAAIGPPACSSNAQSSCNWGCTHCMRSTDISFCPSNQDWGVAFDDGKIDNLRLGPSEFTPAFLDYLDEVNIKISFFVVGSQILRFPDTLKREYDSGHHIVSHTVICRLTCSGPTEL